MRYENTEGPMNCDRCGAALLWGDYVIRDGAAIYHKYPEFCIRHLSGRITKLEEALEEARLRQGIILSRDRSYPRAIRACDADETGDGIYSVGSGQIRYDCVVEDDDLNLFLKRTNRLKSGNVIEVFLSIGWFRIIIQHRKGTETERGKRT